MAKAGYSAPAGADVALVAATAKSVLGVLAPAQFGVDLKKMHVSFDGVTASQEPVLVELCFATFATNPPGTNSTTVTVQQTYGKLITAGFTAARSWSAEPTVLTVLEEFLLTPAGGTVIYDIPLGDTYDCANDDGFVIRCTAPNAVNFRGSLHFERV